MAAPDGLLDLVERFDRNKDAYRSGQYNETQVRREFIDPFFVLLGWDVDNKSGYAEAYKDVIHEDAIKVGGATKAPDYCFRIGGARKFFLEAKKPAVIIREDISAAYQLRRYAWSAKLPLSILTDFEEFAAYDCRIKPARTDKASAARIMYLGCADYPARWDEIASVFSREAVLRGSFDKYAESARAKKGTAEVDSEFLREIESWRDLLARNLALRNPGLSQRELNFAVQRTIDRIVFLRICEDRGLEGYGRLQALVNAGRVHERLRELFRQADERYNSGLFHFQQEKGRLEPPDTLTPGLAIDDRALGEIIRNLYYPDSPYEFSVLPADILGQVYEQFLGKVIRLTAGHRAVVEDKPEVKKAGGVYYTPTYVVDYIVQHTVGKLLEGKTPKQAAKLRILDPACGSGSFLIGAYQYLLDWHRDWYAADGPEKHRRALYQGPGGEWRLTTAERKRILLGSIYGVDIDSQAVEVTKLSLLLKVLEQESAETIDRTLSFFHERALPDLGSNIKCGNSLIGPDFYEGQQMTLLDDEERYRINVFDWEAEFPEIMKSGGFDAVIGNPPYVLLQAEFRDNAQLSYYRSRYTCASYKIDTYHLFIERSIGLTRAGGRCSMITPANLLTNNYLASLRRYVLERSEVDHIIVVDHGVFAGATVDNAVFVITPGRPTTQDFTVVHACAQLGALAATSETFASPSAVRADPQVLFTGAAGRGSADLWRTVEERSAPLSSIAWVNFGKQLRDRRKFPSDVMTVSGPGDVSPPYRLCYTGRDIMRYRVEWSGLVCLDSQIARRGGCWDPERQNGNPKLVTRQIGRYPEFGADLLGYQCLNTVFMVNLKPGPFDLRFVMGVLNSRLLRALWLDRFYDQRHTFPKIKGTYLERMPVRTLDFSEAADKARHDKMVELVEQMLALHKRLAAAKTDHEKTALQRQIDGTDRQIDQLVYELYGLTEEETKIVERGVG